MIWVKKYGTTTVGEPRPQSESQKSALQRSEPRQSESENLQLLRNTDVSETKIDSINTHASTSEGSTLHARYHEELRIALSISTLDKLARKTNRTYKNPTPFMRFLRLYIAEQFFCDSSSAYHLPEKNRKEKIHPYDFENKPKQKHDSATNKTDKEAQTNTYILSSFINTLQFILERTNISLSETETLESLTETIQSLEKPSPTEQVNWNAQIETIKNLCKRNINEISCAIRQFMERRFTSELAKIEHNVHYVQNPLISALYYKEFEKYEHAPFALYEILRDKNFKKEKIEERLNEFQEVYKTDGIVERINENWKEIKSAPTSKQKDTLYSLLRQHKASLDSEYRANAEGTARIREYHKLFKLALNHTLNSLRQKNKPNRKNANAHSNDSGAQFNAGAMQGLISNIALNKITNHLIRLGRIALAETEENSTDSNSLAKTIARSEYWSSEKQTELKQWEELLQKFFIASCFAQRNLRRLVDREGANLRDIFVETKFKEKIDKILLDPSLKQRLFEQVQLIFPNISFTEKQLKDFLFDMRDFASQIRNKNIHFGQLKEWLSAIQHLQEDGLPKNNQKVDPIINKFIEQDRSQFKEKVREELESIQCEKFYSESELKTIIPQIFRSGEEKNLPKFSKILQRYEEAHWRPSKNSRNASAPKNSDHSASANNALAPKSSDHSPRLIPAFKQGNRELLDKTTEEGRRKIFEQDFLAFRYQLLKRVYEGAKFSQWLDTQPTDRLNSFCQKAKERAHEAAMHLNKTALTARMSKLREIRPQEDINAYMHYLQGETAQHMALKSAGNSYQPNPSGSREHADFVEKFRKDIVLLAFASYIQEEGLDFLISKCPTYSDDSTKANSETSAQSNISLRAILESRESQIPQVSINTQTYSRLYMYCHFMPVDNVNLLIHQIKKFIACTSPSEAPANKRGELAEILKVLQFYSDMHDYKFSGTREGALSLPDPLLNENFINADVQAHFRSLDSENLLPIREFREIIRFGDVSLIQQFFSEKVGERELEAFTNASEGIPEAQDKVRYLHDSWVKRSKLSFQDFKKYQEALQRISAYKQSKAALYLQDHKKFYAVLMNMYARLISYVFKWERDKHCIEKLAPHYRPELFTGESANIRNNMVHFHYFDCIGKSADHLRNTQGSNNGTCDLLFILNSIRSLVRHDRKLKNSISAAVKTMLAQYGFTVKFEMKNHELCTRLVLSDKIQHLKGYTPKYNNENTQNTKKGATKPIIEYKNSKILAEKLELLMDFSKKGGEK